MKTDLLDRLNAERRARRAVIRVTDLATGTDRLVTEASLAADQQKAEASLAADQQMNKASLAADDPLHDLLVERLRTGQSGLVETADGARLFLNVHVPPPRIVAIGAVHITQALVPMATIAGFDVTVIDPRTAFAAPERFAGADLRPLWPQDIIPGQLALDGYTALVAVTHDPKIDDFPILAALQARAFYVGALGSRKTHGKRVERLTAAGLSAEDIARIRAPIGLDIGAANPSEIAVSILAEIIAALRGPKTSRAPA